MRVIDKFAEEVFSHDDSFSFALDKKYYSFTRSKVGQATYIYGEDGYEENFESRLDIKLKLVAIVTKGVIYIVDEFLLNVWRYGGDTKLPANVELFDGYCYQQNKWAKNDLFSSFYESLETKEIDNPGTINSCEKKARTLLLSDCAELPPLEAKDVFSQLDIAHSLCGYFDVYDEAMRRFEKDKYTWMAVKAERAKVDSLIQEKSVVEDWEFAIASGLRMVCAKQVTVEFDFNGKKASIKMNPNTIYRYLDNKDNFSSYDFGNRKQGEAMLKELGAATWKGYGEVLTCEHISKIIYGKKELYVK